MKESEIVAELTRTRSLVENDRAWQKLTALIQKIQNTRNRKDTGGGGESLP